MKLNTRFTTNMVRALAVGAALASTAFAGCGDAGGLKAPFTFAPPLALVAHSMAASNIANESNNAMNNTASPVGMWNIQFVSLGNAAHNPTIPDGALIDFGYAQWHTDGTEIMNSGGHAANTGNFCLGVWARTGMFTYEVNHFALSYDGASGALVNKVNIREQITLDPSGLQFSGTFMIYIFNAAGTQQVDHLGGTISATRVSVDQTTP